MTRFASSIRSRAEPLKEVDGTRRPVLVNEAESPLGWLKSRKDGNGRPLISDPQNEAGERLRADYWFARFSPRVTANWSALAPSGRTRRGAPAGAAGLRDEVIAAKERVMRAIEAVGPELAGVLIDICCELKGLEDAEKSHGWPQRAGKVVLELALNRLARRAGSMSPEETHGPQKGIRHWGSDDSADARCVAPQGRSVNRRSALDGEARILADPLHHGEDAVRALGRQVFFKMQAAEHGIGVDVENGIGGFARVKGEQDRDQTARDMGVAVADEAQAWRASIGLNGGRKPDLAHAAVHLIDIVALSLG